MIMNTLRVVIVCFVASIISWYITYRLNEVTLEQCSQSKTDREQDILLSYKRSIEENDALKEELKQYRMTKLNMCWNFECGSIVYFLNYDGITTWTIVAQNMNTLYWNKWDYLIKIYPNSDHLIAGDKVFKKKSDLIGHLESTK